MGWGAGHAGQAHHIDELGDGQSKAHDHHIRGIGHRPCPAVIAPKEVFEEAILGLRVRASLCQHCGISRGEERSPGGRGSSVYLPSGQKHQVTEPVRSSDKGGCEPAQPHLCGADVTIRCHALCPLQRSVPL